MKTSIIAINQGEYRLVREGIVWRIYKKNYYADSRDFSFWGQVSKEYFYFKCALKCFKKIMGRNYWG